MQKVVVIGQGYVGLPVAVRAAEAGFDVIGFDVDAGRVKRLAAGESFIEDITDARLGAVLSGGGYRPPLNTFRHVNIALVNELARFANDLGINIWEAIEAADTKPFGFMKFTPGPGVGGRNVLTGHNVEVL